MKKLLIGLLVTVLIICIGAITWLGVTFNVQYNAANSITEVAEGMYEYTYDGDYGLDEFVANGGASSSIDIAVFATSFLSHGLAKLNTDVEPKEFGCSSIVAPDVNGKYNVGRNFDWHSDAGTNSDIVIVHSHPKTGYKSISTFFIHFLGFGNDYKPQDMTQKFMLLASVYTPLDGMNEKGLYVADLMAGDDEKTNQTGKDSNVTTTLAIRLILDNAATVDEAVSILGQYNMHSDIGMAHHLAISDVSGRSVVVEWVNNEMFVAESPLCTNHYITDCSKKETANYYDNSKSRFDQLKSSLDTHNAMSVDDITTAIASVAGSEYTRWTVVYNRNDMTATYYQKANFDAPYTTSIN